MILSVLYCIVSPSNGCIVPTYKFRWFHYVSIHAMGNNHLPGKLLVYFLVVGHHFTTTLWWENGNNQHSLKHSKQAIFSSASNSVTTKHVFLAMTMSLALSDCCFDNTGYGNAKNKDING